MALSFSASCRPSALTTAVPMDAPWALGGSAALMVLPADAAQRRRA